MLLRNRNQYWQPVLLRSPKKKSKSPKGALELVRTDVADLPEPTPVGQEGDAFARLEQIIHISREVPTVQLFDAIWQLAFPMVAEKKRQGSRVPPNDILSEGAAG